MTIAGATQYMNDAIAELRHVRWPTQRQAFRLSVIVIGFTAASSAIFGLADYGLSLLVKLLLSLTY